MRSRSPRPEHDEKQGKKMILSSRANPPKPLQFGGPKKGGTSTDRYLSIKHLLPSTPIPSPSLPSILPRHGKKPPKLNSRKIVRGILWLSLLIGVYYLVSFGKRKSHELAELTFSSSSGQAYEIVEASELPEHPTPLAFTDSKGKHHWTISIPSALKFPLPPSEYVYICSQAEEVAKHVAGGSSQALVGQQGFDQKDPNYIDVAQAQAQNYLPKEPHHNNQHVNIDLPVCERSLTYILDATDAGFGSALLGIWLSHSLARHESRSFFVDDTHFAYGKYNTFFTTNPNETKCRQPPPSQRVPCPHQANHLVISAATVPWVFGETFHERFSRREIFDMVRKGHDALFHLQPEDKTYLASRAAKLRKSTTDPGISNNNPEDPQHETLTGLIGIHIRRGDRHPFSLPYSRNYIPPSTYTSTALKLVGQAAHSGQWKFLLASDDPDIYELPLDLPYMVRAQERISLASKTSLARHAENNPPPGGAKHNAKDDGLKRGKANTDNGALGWEGGFFKSVFWNLGLSEDEKWLSRKKGSPMPHKERGRFGEKDESGRERRVHHHDEHGHGGSGGNSHSDPKKKKEKNPGHKQGSGGNSDAPGKQVGTSIEVERDYRTNPTKQSLQLRELLARAYLLDLAMLAQSDKVVCGVSANACRILAVMLGWERAFERKDWINVDGGYEWRIMDY